MLWNILGSLVSPVTTIIKGWQTRKEVKLESDIAIAKAQVEAKINRLSTGQQADIQWENLSITNSGWKDEWFTILLSIPMVLCFIPDMAKYVEAGFKALAGTPGWYQWAFGLAVGSSFGYKKIADFMALKKGD